MPTSVRNVAGRLARTVVSGSVRSASAGRPPSSGASDLTSLLRATPSRSTQGTAQAGPVRQADSGPTDEAPAGSTGEGQVGSGSATSTAKLSDPTNTATPSRSAFGETLAASMSSSSTAPQVATPTRGAKTKGTDPKSQTAATLLPALSLPAAATETPASAPASTAASSGGATQAVSAFARGPGSSADTVEADGEPSAAAASPVSLATDTTGSADTTSTNDTAATTAPASQVLSFAAATFASLKPSGQPATGRTQGDEPDQATAPESAISSNTPATSSAAPIAVAHPAIAQLTAAMAQGQGSTDAQSGSSGGASADSGAAANAAGAAGAAAANNAPSAASPTPPPTGTVSVPVHAEVGSTGWAQELGGRLSWMAQAGISSASLHVTPEQLGPVEVRISVHQNNASVWFGAAQPDTRAALEQALPKLKEMFASQGMNLAHSGVSDQSARGAQREPQSQPTLSQAAALRGLNATPVTSAARLHQGLVDTYA